MDYPLPLCSRRDLQLAQQLIESSDLRFEPDVDELIGIFKNEQLAACGARRGRVLKMLVVAPAFRGEGLIGDIIAELMRLGREAGEDGFFIFSRRCAAESFTRLGFKPLAEYGEIILLEHDSELHRYLAKRAMLLRSGNNAAVTVNADPFTYGHMHLVEHAAGIADTVYVFVYAEGPYRFPLPVRLELARRGVTHIGNAVVTDSGPYRLRSDHFPRYFLRPDDDAEHIRIGLEGQLFGRHIAPPFHIHTRVIGTEPLDPASRRYNQMIRPNLAQWNIRLLEIEREKQGDLAISTKRVRKALIEGDRRTLAASVPEPVLDYLSTPDILKFIGGKSQ